MSCHTVHEEPDIKQDIGERNRTSNRIMGKETGHWGPADADGGYRGVILFDGSLPGGRGGSGMIWDDLGPYGYIQN